MSLSRPSGPTETQFIARGAGRGLAGPGAHATSITQAGGEVQKNSSPNVPARGLLRSRGCDIRGRRCGKGETPAIGGVAAGSGRVKAGAGEVESGG